MNPDWFPNLRAFIQEAQYYPHYYSTATSTYMVITDLFFGDSMQFEKSNYLEDIFSIQPTKVSAFDKLAEFGYKTKCYCYGCNAEEQARKHVKVYSLRAECWESLNDVKGMLTDMKDYIGRDEPFAVFVQDFESHLMNMEDFADGIKSSYDLFADRYRMLDNTFGLVIDTLKNSGKYEDTVIIAYGDHGDDLWGHGLHDGYTHAIEPFPCMINCPLVIKNGPELQQNKLLSTTDVYDVIMSAVHDNESFEQLEFAFSRNLFSGQESSENSFNKSYMVTDGRYSLLASIKGMGLYCNGIDAASSKNMLDFFYLKDGEIIYNTNFYHVSSSHYKFFMSEKQIEEFRSEFRVLVRELKKHVSSIYEDTKSQMAFDKIDYSDELKNGQEFQRELKRRSILGKVKCVIKKIMVVD